MDADGIRVETIIGSVDDGLRHDLIEVYASAHSSAPCRRTREDADRWGVEVLARHLPRRGRALVVARRSDSVIGFGYSLPAEDGEWWTATVLLKAPVDVIVDWRFGDHVTLVELAVVPGARGHGAGRALLNALLEASRASAPILLGVDPRADAAQRLYRSAGFVDVFAASPNYQVLGLRAREPKGTGIGSGSDG